MQISQLGDTFYYFLLFCQVDHEKRERREERKEKDG